VALPNIILHGCHVASGKETFAPAKVNCQAAFRVAPPSALCSAPTQTVVDVFKVPDPLHNSEYSDISRRKKS
jgi:hypothetical protein